MKKQPHAITAAIETLVKIGNDHGLDAVNLIYRDTIAELMAGRTREVWRSRITEQQGETFALPGY